MENFSVSLTNYSAGANAYEKIGQICSVYGKTAVIIGGKTAVEAAGDKITSHSGAVHVEAKIWYGGEASRENAELLSRMLAVHSADMIFAVGGGRAADVGKAAADMLSKPVFTFPTVASNAACCSKTVVLHNPDGTDERLVMKNPPIHAFADTEIMCRADVKYLRAGIGRALAQNCDAHIMSRFSDSTHFETVGLALCDTMSQAVLRHGLQACTDNRNHRDTEAFGETAVAVAVTSGMAKNMLLSGDFTTDKFGLANAMLTAVVSAGCNENRSDGEILALCALAALLYDGQVSEYMRLKRIFEKVNLPIILRDVGLSSQSADELAQMVCEAVKKGGYPCKATTETMAVTMKRAFRMLRTV